jgi:hypothetical protein
MFLACIILAGIVVNGLIETPNNTGGGAMMMVLIIALAVIFKATFQFLIGRWRQSKDDGLKQKGDHR